jgi:hypothetical protein
VLLTRAQLGWRVNLTEQTARFDRFPSRITKDTLLMGLIEQEVIAQALVRARQDLMHRLGLSEQDILEEAVEPAEFSNAALGAPVEDEMSAQVITPGWRIRLITNDRSYEYRATERQLRLVNFNGKNYRI